MEDQVLVANAINTPVEAPLKQRKTLITWQRVERLLPVQTKCHLRLPEASNAGWSTHAYRKIGKRAFRSQCEPSIELLDGVRHLPQRCPNGNHKRPHAQTQAVGSVQSFVDLGPCEITELRGHSTLRSSPAFIRPFATMAKSAQLSASETASSSDATSAWLEGAFHVRAKSSRLRTFPFAAASNSPAMALIKWVLDVSGTNTTADSSPCHAAIEIPVVVVTFCTGSAAGLACRT